MHMRMQSKHECQFEEDLQPATKLIKKINGSDVFYHQFGNCIPEHTTKEPLSTITCGIIFLTKRTADKEGSSFPTS
jgi:hypothetical protein